MQLYLLGAAALPEDLESVPRLHSTHIVVHKHLFTSIQDIQHPVLASTDTRHTLNAQTRKAKHK